MQGKIVNLILAIVNLFYDPSIMTVCFSVKDNGSNFNMVRKDESGVSRPY